MLQPLSNLGSSEKRILLVADVGLFRLDNVKIARCVEVKGKKTQTERDITENFAIGTRGLGVKVPEFIRLAVTPAQIAHYNLPSPQPKPPTTALSKA